MSPSNFCASILTCTCLFFYICLRVPAGIVYFYVGLLVPAGTYLYLYLHATTHYCAYLPVPAQFLHLFITYLYLLALHAAAISSHIYLYLLNVLSQNFCYFCIYLPLRPGALCCRTFLRITTCTCSIFFCICIYLRVPTGTAFCRLFLCITTCTCLIFLHLFTYLYLMEKACYMWI